MDIGHKLSYFDSTVETYTPTRNKETTVTKENTTLRTAPEGTES
ncbi:hypothetical protein QFZ30_002799 [Arthrobacter pascens]|nr:hypothetical protein [Arthrobacter pascens]